MKIFKLLKDILSPKKCYSCKKEWHFLCNDCEKKIKKYKPLCFVCKQESEKYKIHKKCKNNNIYYDKIIIKYHYDWYYISKMVKDWKFYQKKDVMREFWEQLWEVLEQNYFNSWNFILIPTPLHFLRYFKRGYNQSELLSDEISKKCNIPTYKNILYRKNITRQQSKLSKIERHKNIKNCFAIRMEQLDKIDKKRIILVDDVVSTGATLNEMAKLLKTNWAIEVIGLCIASD